MASKRAPSTKKTKTPEPEEKRVRLDAQRNLDLLIQAAFSVFMASGVDAPVREIAEKAGVGVATLYRHFPQRSDLVVAVFRKEVDACADAADSLSQALDPGEALSRWMQRYVDFIAAKRGLSAALHSGDAAFKALPDYFKDRLLPAFQGLLNAAEKAGEIRPGTNAWDLLCATASLSSPYPGLSPDHARNMVALLVDGLRHGAAGKKPRKAH